MSSKPEHPLKNAQDLVRDATKQLHVGTLREEWQVCDEKLRERSLEWEELRELLVKHKDHEDWFARSVDEAAPLFDDNRALVQKMLQLSMIDQTAIHLYNTLYRLSRVNEAPLDPQTYTSMQKDITQHRQTLKKMVAAFAGVDTALAGLVTDSYLGNLRQHLGLEKYLGR